MHIIFHDGTERCIISSTTGRDGTFFFFDGTGGTFFVFTTGRDGTHIFFTAAEETTMKNTLLSAPRQQRYKLKLYIVLHLPIKKCQETAV